MSNFTSKFSLSVCLQAFYLAPYSIRIAEEKIAPSHHLLTMKS